MNVPSSGPSHLRGLPTVSLLVQKTGQGLPGVSQEVVETGIAPWTPSLGRRRVGAEDRKTRSQEDSGMEVATDRSRGDSVVPGQPEEVRTAAVEATLGGVGGQQTKGTTEAQPVANVV